MISDSDLIKQAASVAKPRRTTAAVEFGGVGAALVTDRGNVFAGVCIDAACGIGFCAEHAAIGSMATAGESRIVTIVAVGADGAVVPPCGRCREFIRQMDDGNGETRILLKNDRVAVLRDLLPEHWLFDLDAPTSGT